MPSQTRLLFIAGSSRTGSYNKRLAELGAAMAHANGIQATFADLGDYPLPLYNGDDDATSGPPENARKLLALMAVHSGIFIASPEYNASISPLLKNAIDWVSRIRDNNSAGLEVYRTRVFALGAASPGGTGGMRGLVTVRNVHPGALVGPQGGSTVAPLLKIEQVHKLRLTVAVPESLVGGIAENAHASFAVRSFPGAKFDGVTKRVSASIDPKTRSMPVELDVDNADGRLAPGMFASVVWPVKRAVPSLFVPPSAIAQSTDRTFVVRIKDGTVEQVPVQRGISQGDLVEVFGALDGADVVAKRGSEDLRNGMHVQTKAAAKPDSH